MVDFKKLYRALSEGRSLRDVGMDRALDGQDDWKLEVFTKVILKLPHRWRGIGEDIRIMAAAAGIKPPRTPQSWGGYINGLIRQGYLVPLPTVPHKPMQVPKSHARQSLVLERGW